MSSRPQTRRSMEGKWSSAKRKKKPGWLSWWPVVLGILVTPLARRSADVLAMEGPAALQTLYPYVELVKLHFFRLPEDLASGIAQVMMYAQFPLYGLFMALILRWRGLMLSVVWTVLLHSVPLLLLIVIARP